MLVQISFANDPSALITIPAKGSYAKNVNDWASLGTIATDKSSKLLPYNEVCIGNYGYNIRASIRTTDVQKIETMPESSPTNPMSMPTVTYSKVKPTLEIILDRLPLGSDKGKLKGKIANFKK